MKTYDAFISARISGCRDKLSRDTPPVPILARLNYDPPSEVPRLISMKQTLQLKLSQQPDADAAAAAIDTPAAALDHGVESGAREISGRKSLLEREDTDSEIPTPPAHMNGEQATALQAPAEDASTETPSQTDIFSADTDWGGESGPSSGSRDDTDEGDFFQVPAESPNLREYLHRQLTLTKLEPRDRNLVRVPDRSPGRRRLSHAAHGGARAARARGIADRAEELEIALKHLQNFDPTGVGARNCAEMSRVAAAGLARVHAEPRHGPRHRARAPRSSSRRATLRGSGRRCNAETTSCARPSD